MCCFPWPTSSCHSANFLSGSSVVLSHIFWHRWSTVIFLHRVEYWMQAPTVWALELLTITGKICWKSPPNTNVTPPKGLSEFHTSCSVLSTASTMWQCCMGASSQITNCVPQINSARCDSLGMLHTEDSWQGIGILNCEWAAQPPCRKRAAMPEDATHSTILVWERRWWMSSQCLQAHEGKKSGLIDWWLQRWSSQRQPCWSRVNLAMSNSANWACSSLS